VAPAGFFRLTDERGLTVLGLWREGD